MGTYQERKAAISWVANEGSGRNGAQEVPWDLAIWKLL